MLILSQDFNWHDRGEGGSYAFGKDGYLTLDGSTGRAACSRMLTNPIGGSRSAIELKLRVTLGKSYCIRLSSRDDLTTIDCRIDRNGRILFASAGNHLETALSLTYHYGKPFSNSLERESYVVPSDEHTFRFEFFDLAQGSVRFTLDDKGPVTVHFCGGTNDISRIELITQNIETGSLFHLKEFSEYELSRIVLKETFPVHWEPVDAPLDGMPDDNVCDTFLRPVDYRWLETKTRYGYVKARIPTLAKGAVEFDMKTDDASSESCLILEEHQGITKYGNIQFGLLRGSMVLCTAEGITRFDQSIDIAHHHVYKFRVEWDISCDAVHLWINGSQMTGDENPSFFKLPRTGIDTITLHPGNSSARLSLQHKQQGLTPLDISPLVTHWANFRVYDLS